MVQYSEKGAPMLLEQAEHAIQGGDLEQAEAYFKEFARLYPQKNEGWCGLAWLALQAGQNEMAIAFAGRAVERDPQSACHILLGQALERSGYIREAEAAFIVAGHQFPQSAEAFFEYGLYLARQKRSAEAEKMLCHAVSLFPQEKRYYQALARFYLDTRQVQMALDVWEKAASLFPKDVALLQEWVALLGAVGQTGKALVGLRTIAELLPEDAAAHSNLGAGLFVHNQLEEARKVLEYALRLKPDSPEALSNLGLVLMAEGYLPEAQDIFERASQNMPDDNKIQLNYATLLTDMGQKQKAAHIYSRLMAQIQDKTATIYQQARFNLSTIDLAEGKMAQGWEGFESRRALLGVAYGHSLLPEWNGEADEWATVLVVAEQGLGDFIQFLRYVPYASRRVKLIVEVPAALLSLVKSSQALKAQAKHTCLFIEQGSYRYGATARVNLLSLPYVLKQYSVPDFSVYLGQDTKNLASSTILQAPAAGLGEKEVLRIGIAWAGSASYRFDRRRSLMLEQLIPVMVSQKNVEWWSLQYGYEKAYFDTHAPGLTIKPLSVKTMRQTAEVLTHLDLVISVDTALIHLAGAMGRPAWLLNRFGGDWRWSPSFWCADGSSMWYPSVRQFVQTSYSPPEQAWNEPLSLLHYALEEWQASRETPRL